MFAVGQVIDVDAQSDDVQVLLVDQPRNIAPDFVILVVLLLVVLDAHVGNATFVASDEQVILPLVVVVYDVPALFLRAPLPPFLFNVMVFVFAVHFAYQVPAVVVIALPAVKPELVIYPFASMYCVDPVALL